jgi:tetratricopeptide (TPR) repeat protein
MQADQMEQAAAEYREAIRLEPHAAVSMGNLIRVYLILDRLDEAKAVAEQARAKGVDVSAIHLSLLQIAYTQGDSKAAEKEIQWLLGKQPEEYISMQMQASDALMRGQRRKAEELQQRSDELARRQGFDQFGRFGLATVSRAEMGDCAGSQKKDSPPGVTAVCGDVNAAQKAIERIPPNSVRDYWRAVINLRSNKGAEAAVGFQKILDHRGANWGLEYALSYVGLARASVLTGDIPKAKRAYQDFFALWKDADPDIPILIEAKKEYAALR